VHIRRLRKILAASGAKNAIDTIRGFGYRFLEKPQ
jgi:DNA-binding response OmpR family regulator